MTVAYTNKANLPLSLAVWLTHDTYDHDDRANHISATSLIKHLRQLILGLREIKDDLKEFGVNG